MQVLLLKDNFIIEDIASINIRLSSIRSLLRLYLGYVFTKSIDQYFFHIGSPLSLRDINVFDAFEQDLDNFCSDIWNGDSEISDLYTLSKIVLTRIDYLDSIYGECLKVRIGSDNAWRYENGIEIEDYQMFVIFMDRKINDFNPEYFIIDTTEM